MRAAADWQRNLAQLKFSHIINYLTIDIITLAAFSTQVRPAQGAGIGV
jgi:hypothetical protein